MLPGRRLEVYRRFFFTTSGAHFTPNPSADTYLRGPKISKNFSMITGSQINFEQKKNSGTSVDKLFAAVEIILFYFCCIKPNVAEGSKQLSGTRISVRPKTLARQESASMRHSSN